MQSMNLFRMSAEDEAAVRDHHGVEGGYERCVICRLLATIDYERELPLGMVLVRADSGGVFPNGTTNTPPIDFTVANEPVDARPFDISVAVKPGPLFSIERIREVLGRFGAPNDA